MPLIDTRRMDVVGMPAAASPLVPYAALREGSYLLRSPEGAE